MTLHLHKKSFGNLAQAVGALPLSTMQTVTGMRLSVQRLNILQRPHLLAGLRADHTSCYDNRQRLKLTSSHTATR